MFLAIFRAIFLWKNNTWEVQLGILLWKQKLAVGACLLQCRPHIHWRKMQCQDVLPSIYKETCILILVINSLLYGRSLHCQILTTLIGWPSFWWLPLNVRCLHTTPSICWFQQCRKTWQIYPSWDFGWALSLLVFWLGLRPSSRKGLIWSFRLQGLSSVQAPGTCK